MQGHKVADVVGDEDPSVGHGILQECCVSPPVLLNIIDALGINASLAQLRREGGMDVFVEEEGQRDGSVFSG